MATSGNLDATKKGTNDVLSALPTRRRKPFPLDSRSHSDQLRSVGEAGLLVLVQGATSRIGAKGKWRMFGRWGLAHLWDSSIQLPANGFALAGERALMGRPAATSRSPISRKKLAP
jgi:hypothetical protein